MELSGLDYDRLQFCPKEVQEKYFEAQIELAEKTQLPMFLHLRNAHEDFIEIVRRNRSRIVGGVVHSYDGPLDAAMTLIGELDLYIGLNGCSLRTPENLDVAAALPLDRLMIETDAPWCQVKATHAGMKHVRTKFDAKKKEKHERGLLVKGRNEPACLVQVLEVLAALHRRDPAEVAALVHATTTALFRSLPPSPSDPIDTAY